MTYVRWFLGGALAVPLFHQVVLAILNAIGSIARKPYGMAPTEPFGVPQVISLSFWGGIWGVILALVLRRTRTPRAFWLTALLFGAIAPPLVAGLVVAPLKGQAAGGDAKMIVTGLLVNAAWGIGTALIARLLGGRRDAAQFST